mmetsp:Transcript_6863/g.18640  ORF Transcript_6863/g.18640 Transcript_6863/m.18640 type:complete len:92 (-) Transcript_6863:957-1232(-)
MIAEQQKACSRRYRYDTCSSSSYLCLRSRMKVCTKRNNNTSTAKRRKQDIAVDDCANTNGNECNEDKKTAAGVLSTHRDDRDHVHTIRVLV